MNGPGACLQCNEPLENPGERRLQMHRECGVRMAVGSVGHQLGRCWCKGGDDAGDPPGMTAREAARAAMDLFVRLHPDSDAAGDGRPSVEIDGLAHPSGDRECPECWSGFPKSCGCGGLVHAQFGDEDADCEYWLYYRCDRCGSTGGP